MSGPADGARVSDGLIEADSVCKSFGEVVAVDQATFRVEPGEFVSIVGPSGCGKSTLLGMIGGLILPTAGGVAIDGRGVKGPSDQTAMMFQKPTLLPWRTAMSNVLLPQSIKGRVSDEDRAKALELLDLLGLRQFEHKYPAQLSGGMEQRVALARLLIQPARVLLMDEPFAALDEFTRERLNLELIRLHQATRSTAVLVTHSIIEAVFLADRVIVMSPRPGRIVDVVTVPFGRDREVAIMRKPDFTSVMFEVREALGAA